MKKLLYNCCFAFFLNFTHKESAENTMSTIDTPKDPTVPKVQVATKYDHFIKNNHRIIDSASGDLNKDNNPDIALVTEEKMDEKFNRELIILFFNPNTGFYVESTRSGTAIPESDELPYDGPDDYFGKLSIKNGTLIFENQLSPAGNEKYIYRFQNSQWKLIGYSGNYPKQGYAFNIDYNLNTGRFLADINAVSEDTSFIKLDTLIQLKEIPDIEEYSPGSLDFNIRGLNVYL